MEDIILNAVRNGPEVDPPADLTRRIMGRLHPKRPSVWTRLRLWLLQPWVVAVRPVTAIPAMTLAVALLVLGFAAVREPAGNGLPGLAPVRFILHDAGMHARNVSVVGSFNHWQADRSVMWYSPEARAWVLEAQLPPGDYEYLFLVNGNQFVPDPNAPMSSDDGFGHKNSIVFVNGKNEQAL